MGPLVEGALRAAGGPPVSQRQAVWHLAAAVTHPSGSLWAAGWLTAGWQGGGARGSVVAQVSEYKVLHASLQELELWWAAIMMMMHTKVHKSWPWGEAT